jgi:ATP-binding cassette subfamily B protein
VADARDDGIHEEDALGKVYDGRLFRRLLAYVRPYRPLVFFALVALLGENLLVLVGPTLTQRVIDNAIPARNVAYIEVAALIYAASLVVQFGCSYAETLLTSLLGQRVMRELRLELFAHLQQLPVSFFDRNPVGRLITRVTSDVEALNELFTAGVVSGLGDLFALVVIGVRLVVIDWRLALASFTVIPLVVLTSHVFRIKVRRAYREIRTRLARINAFLQERLTGMRIVQLFGRERREAARFDSLNRDHLDANLRSITYYALYFPAIEILTSFALASVLVAGAGLVHISAPSLGTLTAFLMFVRRFFQPLQDLSDKYNTLQQAMASSERIFKLLDEPIGDAAGFVAWQGEKAARESGSAKKPEPARRGVRPSSGVTGVTVAFEDVWFAYGGPRPAAPGVVGEPVREGIEDQTGRDASPQWVLRGVSFRVAPGETIAIVGHTGAGKTTIVSLLMRFYDPQRGRITLDGVDIRDMPVDELRARIGYVQQDIFLFAGDVASNIRLSGALSEQDVERAAARVGADRVIKRLPGGYHYRLGERGASISVGERQLLSFARAIAADPALLILDEATSAVDSELEAEIQAALVELMRGRTTIAIAHRLSTIVDADEILVMQHGEIRERGTHRDLITIGGLYDRLYRLQVGEAEATV